MTKNSNEETVQDFIEPTKKKGKKKKAAKKTPRKKKAVKTDKLVSISFRVSEAWLTKQILNNLN